MRRVRPAGPPRERGARRVVVVHERGVLDRGGVRGPGARQGRALPGLWSAPDGGEEREGRLSRSRLRLGRRAVDRGDVPGAWGTRRRDGVQGYDESDQHRAHIFLRAHSDKAAFAPAQSTRSASR